MQALPSTCYFATSSEGKLREMQVLAKKYFPSFKKIIGRAAVKAEESALTFAGNAEIKARALSQELRNENLKNFCVIADDSGLVVPALKGRPGVFSARYAGPAATSQQNMEKLLEELKEFKNPLEREAHFSCALHLKIVLEGTEVQNVTALGHCDGYIGLTKQGEKGFGYDPIFISKEYGKSFANLDTEEKNKVSHRRRAIEDLAQKIGNGT